MQPSLPGIPGPQLCARLVIAAEDLSLTEMVDGVMLRLQVGPADGPLSTLAMERFVGVEQDLLPSTVEGLLHDWVNAPYQAKALIRRMQMGKRAARRHARDYGRL